MHRRNFVKTGLAGVGTLALAKSGFAMKTASEEKTWAVIFGTQCGSSQEAAEGINEGLGGIADVLNVADNPDFSSYDHVILGGPIQMSEIYDPVEAFINSNKNDLAGKIEGMYVVAGNMGKPLDESHYTKYITNHLQPLIGVSDKPGKVFPGRATPSCGGANYDEFDRNLCVTFGEEIYEPFKVALKYANVNNSSIQFGLTLRQGTAATPTAIAYNLPVAGHVELAVCGLNGRTLATLISGYQKANSYTVNWDGGKLAAGNYLVRLKAGNFTKTRKVAVYR